LGFFFVSCSTCKQSGEEWPTPEVPISRKIAIVPLENNNGYFLSTKDAESLAGNIEELKAYIEKLETLIKAMKKYYKAK